MYTYMYKHMCIDIYIYIYTHIYIHIYMYMYMYMYIHVYTRMYHMLHMYARVYECVRTTYLNACTSLHVGPFVWHIDAIPNIVLQCVAVSFVRKCAHLTSWRRRKGCLICIGHFPQKSPMICGSFAEWDLQLKAFSASSPPCTPPSISGSVCGTLLQCVALFWGVLQRVSREPVDQKGSMIFCGDQSWPQKKNYV